MLALVSLGALLVSFVGLWLVSLKLEDASIVDVFWGPSFLVAASVALWLGEGDLGRRSMIFVLVLVWAARLGAHLFARNRNKPEDYRYAEMRQKHGARFGWVSLWTVFVLQAVLSWIISAPILAAGSSQATLGALDLVAAGLVVTGIAIESVADHQLRRFKADPTNEGRVLDTGLWRYSRHPNYFGDAVVWWGLGLFGAAAGAPATLIGPLVMTILLRRVSGVTLLEKTITSRRPGYARYIEETSPFLPWPPKTQA